MTPCCEGATTCLGCGRSWCRAETVSPGEASGLCVDCYEQEDPCDDIGDELLRRALSTWGQGDPA